MFHPDNDLRVTLARRYTEERLREAAIYRRLKQRKPKGQFQVVSTLIRVAGTLSQILGSFFRPPEGAIYPGATQVTCEECTA